MTQVVTPVSPFGPGPASIEELIYTDVPLSHHLLTPWEGVLQTLVFSLLLIRWEKSTSKRLSQILVLASIILLAGIMMGVIQAICGMRSELCLRPTVCTRRR